MYKSKLSIIAEAVVDNFLKNKPSWSDLLLNPESKDFRDHLSPSKVRTLKKKRGLPGFEPVKFDNGRTLSIQASSFHSSKPTEDGLDPHEYTHWQVNIPDDLDLDNEFNSKFGHLISSRSKILHLPTALSVPTEDVQKMFDHVKGMAPLDASK